MCVCVQEASWISSNSVKIVELVLWGLPFAAMINRVVLIAVYSSSLAAYLRARRYDANTNEVWRYPAFDHTLVTVKQLQEFALRSYTSVQSTPLVTLRRRNISSAPPVDPPPPQLLVGTREDTHPS
jgi:hypothetical protein